MSTLNPDLSKPTCRVCLQSNHDGEMASIFDVDMDFYDLHIYEKIEQCAGIKVLRHEKMPTLICSDCYGFLKVSFRFRIICRNSNEYLKEFVAIGPTTQKIEKPQEPNPLLISGNTTKKEVKRSQYKTKLKDRPVPLPQDIKNEQNNSSHSSTISHNFIDSNIDTDDGEEMWFHIDYQGDGGDISCSEDIEVSIENKKIEEPHKIQTPAKHQKTTRAKEKQPSTAPSKTLEISSDGAAIIREKKPFAKRVKKEKQPHICEVCGNIYQRRYALELHMRRHRDEKPYECEICGYAFHSNFELIRHMRKHTGSRPYKCTYCSRAFGDQSTLIKHERIHRNERPFKCDTCGKSFTYSNVLKHHKLTHTGEKPYTCELCGKCFTRPHHLRAHLETLQHQSDPRSKILLQNIRKNNEDETLKVDNFTH